MDTNFWSAFNRLKQLYISNASNGSKTGTSQANPDSGKN